MFDKMLMHVLALERADVWILEANACAATGGGGTCRDLLLRQLAVAAPRLVLAMGAAAPAIVGASAVGGEWSHARNADVLTTFHPEELLARPGEKRAALDHLTALRQRL
jgi:uracil-DNA glycosylase